MKATVFPKADHAAPEAFNGSRIALGAPSVVQLQMGPERVAQYKRHGNDLLLTLDDGTVLTIENFFVTTPSGRNDLVFRDGDDVTWWAQYGEAWTGFDIAEINSGDATAPLALPLPLLAGLGLLAGGLGGALALGGGGGGGGGGAAAVNVPLNAPPTGVAGPDPARTAEDTPLGGMVRGSDPDGDRLIYTLGGDGPRHGVVTVNPDGTYTYTPNADYHGPDSFDVIISDGRGGNVTVTVPVTVTPADDIVPDRDVTHAGAPVTTPVLNNDSFEGADARITGVTPGAHGSVVVNPDGTITYTPNQGYVGEDSYTYTVTSGGKEETTTVVITVLISAEK